jgi:gliding motility-associated protein GldM
MAGGKETPRQKMIGMMYLVLTALLALNVSKEIINAFAKLDMKLMESNTIILNNRDALMSQFDAMMLLPANKPIVKPWQEKAIKVKDMAYVMDKYINIECKNELIKAVEHKDYVTEDPKNKGRFLTISPMEIQTKDDYDAATRLFGGEPGTPGFQKGAEIREKIMKYRDEILVFVTQYNDGKRDYKFNPKNITATEGEELDKQLKSELEKNVFPEDRDKVQAIYKMLTIPEKLKDFEEEVEWQLGMFDHAPIVAASALFTALSNDIRNAEVKGIEILLSRVKVPTFNFNKIEPLAFARSNYMNMGDSMQLSVMIAAYDSTEIPQIKYGIDADTANEANWKEIKGKIKLEGKGSGEHTVKGLIGVKEKGEIKWKPWRFAYEVGEPTAAIGNIEMNVLYVGYENKLKATASGFPPDKVTLTSSGANISKKADYYSVIPSNSMAGKEIDLSVSGKTGTGSKSLGSFKFKVRRLPTPSVYFNNTPNTSSTIKKTELLSGGLTAQYEPSVPLNIKFKVNGFDMIVIYKGAEKKFTSNSNAMTSEQLQVVRAMSAGQTVTFKNIRIAGPAGNMAGPPVSFTLQ